MICKLCGRIIYDEICYTKDPRFCLDCGSNRHQYFKQRRDTLSSLREMNLESKIVQTKPKLFTEQYLKR
jgi:predicted  nucleic acid-binding Zn-ribbon protein